MSMEFIGLDASEHSHLDTVHSFATCFFWYQLRFLFRNSRLTSLRNSYYC